MFERFTERARQALVLAQDEAVRLGHDEIGTEHLLLGLLREEEGVAARVLEGLRVDAESVRAQVAGGVPPAAAGGGPGAGHMPFTRRAKKALELSLREALSLGHDWIGTEHLLLGLVRDREATAVRILCDRGVDPDTVRQRVLGALEGRDPDADTVAAIYREGTPYVPLLPPPRASLPLGVALALAAAALAAGLVLGWAIWA